MLLLYQKLDRKSVQR